MNPCDCACRVKVRVRGGARSVCLWFCAFSCLARLRARHTVTTRRLTRQVPPALRECDERAPQYGLRPPWHQRMRIPRTTSPLMRPKKRQRHFRDLRNPVGYRTHEEGISPSPNKVSWSTDGLVSDGHRSLAGIAPALWLAEPQMQTPLVLHTGLCPEWTSTLQSMGLTSVRGYSPDEREIDWGLRRVTRRAHACG